MWKIFIFGLVLGITISLLAGNAIVRQHFEDSQLLRQEIADSRSEIVRLNYLSQRSADIIKRERSLIEKSRSLIDRERANAKATDDIYFELGAILKSSRSEVKLLIDIANLVKKMELSIGD